MLSPIVPSPPAVRVKSERPPLRPRQVPGGPTKDHARYHDDPGADLLDAQSNPDANPEQRRQSGYRRAARYPETVRHWVDFYV